jgi:hypothetical protein
MLTCKQCFIQSVAEFCGWYPSQVSHARRFVLCLHARFLVPYGLYVFMPGSTCQTLWCVSMPGSTCHIAQMSPCQVPHAILLKCLHARFHVPYCSNVCMPGSTCQIVQISPCQVPRTKLFKSLHARFHVPNCSNLSMPGCTCQTVYGMSPSQVSYVKTLAISVCVPDFTCRVCDTCIHPCQVLHTRLFQIIQLNVDLKRRG